MEPIELRKKFGAKLKQYIRSKHVRQFKIAALLDVSGSAVSQVMHGKIMLSLAQLNKICEYLALDSSQTYELQSLLVQLRNGADALRSPFNRQFFALRCQRGLSICQLAKLTGIPGSKLRSFEEDFEPIFTPDDAARCGGVFNVSPQSLLASANLRWGATEPMPESELPLEVAEKPAYEFENSLPMLKMSVLGDFDPAGSLADFAEAKADGMLDYTSEVKLALIAVRCPAGELDFEHTGEITLLLSTEEFASDIVLAKLQSGNFALLERNKRTWRPVFGTARNVGEIVWQLPVYEMSFCSHMAD